MNSAVFKIIRLKSDLKAARRKIEQLQKELEAERPDVNVSSLRRATAFYVHPDRGGDASLMKQLNVLFDSLE